MEAKNFMINMRRVKRAMAKKRAQKLMPLRLEMPFKSDNYTDPFYTKANFDRLRLSIARAKASENRMIERFKASL